MFKLIGIKRQILISSCMYLGQILAGFITAWSGPVIPKLQVEESPLPFLLSETQISLVDSIIYLGGLPGPYLIGWISNIKGRKPVIVSAGVFGILGYTILVTTSNLTMIYIGRIFTGFATGIINVMNVVYIGEIASTHIRGILLTILEISHTIGTITAFSAVPFVSYSVACYIGLAIATTLTLSSLTISETPLFHLMRGEEMNMAIVLTELGRSENIAKMSETIKPNQLTKVEDRFELFKLKSNRKALLIVLTLNILQHTSGVLVIVFFAASVFEMAGSSIDFNIAMIVICLFEFCGSALSPMLVERTGRRSLLMASTAICSLSMVLLGTYFYLYHIEYLGIKQFKWIPFVLLSIFFIGFNFGFGIIPNAISGEMFTANPRSNGTAVAMTVLWFAGFLITTAFGAVVKKFGVYTMFWFFTFTCTCAFTFTLFVVPETKGKTLIEIQELLAK